MPILRELANHLERARHLQPARQETQEEGEPLRGYFRRKEIEL